jgi:predicted PurR-regulated permease PerM
MIDWINKTPRWLAIELLIPLTLLNGWFLLKGFQYFEDLTAILLVAVLMSFLLGYPVRSLQRWGLSKGLSVLAVFVSALAIIVLGGMAVVPTLVQQMGEFTTQLPHWLESGQQQLKAVDSEIAQLPIGESMDIDVLATQVVEAVPGELKLLPNQILGFALSTADNLVDSLFTVVLTLYFLLHGEAFWQGLLRWLPHDFGERVQAALRSQFQSYFVGQAAIGAITGSLLAGVFFVFGLPYWLVFGLGVGIAGLVPFGDLLVMLSVGLLVGVNEPMLGVEVIAACLVVDQIVDNVFAPKILGGMVGLNPIWILLSLLVGAQVGGVLGAIIAVPSAGSIKQIIDSFQAGEFAQVSDALAVPVAADSPLQPLESEPVIAPASALESRERLQPS